MTVYLFNFNGYFKVVDSSLFNSIISSFLYMKENFLCNYAYFNFYKENEKLDFDLSN